MKKSVRFNRLNKKDFTAEELKYIDPESLNETIYAFEFPRFEKPDENGYIMTNDLYLNVANLLKMEYMLPMKYLSQEVNSCKYIAQKSIIIGKEKNIENASVVIEPENPNVFEMIQYTPINQLIPLGTVFTIDVEIPYYLDDGSVPNRKKLTSKSIKTEINLEETIKKIKPDAKFLDLCNRKLQYITLDIGSKLEAKYKIEESNLYKSMQLFRFRRPEDNILEFVVYDLYNLDINDIFKMMLKYIDIKLNTSEERKIKLKEFINELIKL